ncbi:MAG TPA: AAA family ATPase, partial [Phycisphaerae bacterium]|nr:AAA family ATPase [Phycisphaerae bacterium]
MSDQLAATTRMSSLPPVPPNWLWENRLPRGKIVLLAGPSGSGKTFLAIDLAARITTSREFPNTENRKPNTENCSTESLNSRPGSVLLVTPQEDLLDNIRPRLHAAQADPDKITSTSELSLERLKDRIDQLENLQLIIIDPLFYLVANDHETMSPAQKLFDLYQHGYARYVTVLALMSMRPGRGDPLHRIPGIVKIGHYASLIYAVSP